MTQGPRDVALLRPADGWTRAAVLAWLAQLSAGQANMLIGFDLSPALPFADSGAYFPGWAGSPANPRALWQLVDRIAADEPHLTAGQFVDYADIAPYFRRHGAREGALFGGGIGRLRAVERRQRETRQASSSSCFNLVGAAQVGKASLSGMRLFHRLDGAIPFWPFDPLPERGPCLIEIYTSIAARAAGVAAGRSKMRDADALAGALRTFDARGSISGRIDDHATDALVTAAWLRRVANDNALWQPQAMTPDIASTEGWTFGVI